MKNYIYLLAILFITACSGEEAQQSEELSPAVSTDDNVDHIYAAIITSKGTITVDLAYEHTPMTVANFILLAEGIRETPYNKKGEPYYDGLTFHRVMENFMIQGGDPMGTGGGGPGYTFKDEFTSLKHDRAGTLSMANRGPNTNGSQFFITHNETPWLDGLHTVFGYVVDGQNSVDNIRKGDVIEHIEIIRVGRSAEAFNPVEAFEKGNR